MKKAVIIVLVACCAIFTILCIRSCMRKTYAELQKSFNSCIQSSFIQRNINLKDKADIKEFELIIDQCKQQVIE
jgi:hypothetical protein